MKFHASLPVGGKPRSDERKKCGKIRAGILNISCARSGMDLPFRKLNDFVPTDRTFGYFDKVDAAYQLLREFETITTIRLEKIKLKSNTSPR